MVSRKISLFGKIKRGRSPSFELLQLDMYEKALRDELVKVRQIKPLGTRLSVY